MSDADDRLDWAYDERSAALRAPAGFEPAPVTDGLAGRLDALADELEREADSLAYGIETAHLKRRLAKRIRAVVRGVE